MKKPSTLKLPLGDCLLALLVFFALSVSDVWSQIVDAGHYRIDSKLKLIVCNQIPAIPGGSQTVTLQLDKPYIVSGSVGSAFQVGKEYSVVNSNVTYTLFFTDLPIIHVKTDKNAVISTNDDILTRGTISIADASGQPFTSNMGIRVRGGLSRGYPKKSYKVELSTDAAGKEEREETLLGLREDSEWLLMAMYKEPLRNNNKAGWALWERMHTLPYAAKEPDAREFIGMRYCDVFINDSYNGIYAFTEQIDRKQLKLKKEADDGTVRGELYKADDWSGATEFDGLPALPPNTGDVWAGYELKLPKKPFWNNLYNLVEFVYKAQAEEFKTQIGTRMHLPSLMDYFIFLNVIRGTDNYGKNTYVARYKEGDPYFIVPWDLDGTYGYLWNGTKTNRHIDILSNGLFNRLLSIDSYQRELKKRWFKLRENELSNANIKNDWIASSTFLTNQGAYLREKKVWSTTLAPDDLSYVTAWIDRRMTYLDQYFATLLDENSPLTTVGNFEGFLGSANCNTISGWVWDINQPRAAIAFEVLDNETPVASGLASNYRDDLKTRGDGKHGFVIPFPESLKDNKPHTIRIQVPGSNFILKQSGMKVTCAGTGTPPPPVNQPPVAPTSLPNLTATVNTLYTQTLPPFTDPEKQSLTYTLTGLPESLSFNAGSLQITGTPKSTGVYSLTYTATDQPGLTKTVTLSLTVSTTPTPPPPVSGNFDGYLDKVECGTIRGWVWDRDKGNTAITVEFYTENPTRVWGSTLANIFRQDLKDAGKGNGAHAYSFTVPTELKDNTERPIFGRVAGSTFVLKGSPKTLKCPPATGRLSAESTDDLQVTLLGNPVSNREIAVEVRGAQGQPLRLELTDVLGRLVTERSVKEASLIERHVLPVGSPASGVLLLRVTSGQRSITVKALKP
ncbi:CotH kinase family protein [Larkinella bovis]|uniref:CotH kinase family protein n=1 Tax=Larkinella bovis TaxID=683041 RepID=A0ABW0I7Z9_9BACT